MTAAPISIREVKLKAISAMREAYRAEQDCQIVHDSIHTRRGWTRELERAGGGEWVLEVAGTAVGKGGILFHYNPPYGDIYMEVDEPHRDRGYGGYLVQELKRLCRELGGLPGARYDPTNIASR